MKMIMKKYFSILSAVLLLAGCAKEVAPVAEPEDNTPNNGEVTFVAGFTKVSTDNGVNSWESGDKISVFSVANGADAGVSVGANLGYETISIGPSASFIPIGESVPASDKYYAFSPYLTKYASKLNAAESIGFAGAAANTDVTDYRYMPVMINSGATFIFDPESGDSYSNDTKPFFYASGVAPANEGDPVALSFKPVLPLLEFDLYGYGSIKQVVVAFTDPATDVFAQNNWLTAKGVIDLSTGVMTVTNQSASAYFKLNVTVKEEEKTYIDLLGDRPMKMKLVVGHFNVTKGLSLTFTDKDDNSFTKNIWADKTVCSVTPDGKVKHIRQGINVPYVMTTPSTVEEFAAEGGTSAPVTVNTNSVWGVKSCPDWISLSIDCGTGGDQLAFTAAANTGAARSDVVVLQTDEGAVCSIAVSQAKFQAAEADYYSVGVSAIDFSASYIYDVKNASDELIARITREFLGATQNVRVSVAYPAPSGTPNYKAGLVIDNGGSVDAWTMDPAAVSYTSGSSAALQTIWVKNDGSEILTTQPSGSISAASVSPYVLISPSEISHALVKIGSWIWTAEGYKTTKFNDGTDINNILGPTGALQSTAAVYVCTISDEAVYLYNSYAVNNTKFAPAGGWALIKDTNDWKTTLNTFLGGTASYDNMGTNKAQLFSRNCYKKPDATAPQDLGYYNTWTGTKSGSQWAMIYCSSNTVCKASAQDKNKNFEVRLVLKPAD